MAAHTAGTLPINMELNTSSNSVFITTRPWTVTTYTGYTSHHIHGVYKSPHTQGIQVTTYTGYTSHHIHRVYKSPHTQGVQVTTYTGCTSHHIHCVNKLPHTQGVQVTYTGYTSHVIHRVNKSHTHGKQVIDTCGIQAT